MPDNSSIVMRRDAIVPSIDVDYLHWTTASTLAPPIIGVSVISVYPTTVSSSIHNNNGSSPIAAQCAHSDVQHTLNPALHIRIA